MHVIMDGYSDNLELMTNRDKMVSFMRECIALAGMTPHGQGYCEGFPFPGSDDHTALTCFMPMKESGMVMHPYPEQGFIFIDFFSCLDFDIDAVLGHISRAFNMNGAHVLMIDRGLRNGRMKPTRFLMKSDLYINNM